MHEGVMLQTSAVETRFIVHGKANGFTRRWAGECPHKVGGGLILATPEGTPYAKCKIVSIRPEPLSRRASNDDLAKKDGFTNAQTWLKHWHSMFGPADCQTFRLQVRVEEFIAPE